jgi:hypothetical protein
VHEFGTEPGYRLGTEPEDHAGALSYSFDMTWYHHITRSVPGRGKPGWLTRVGYSYVTLGMSFVTESPAERGQAIEVAKKAARRAPVTGEPNPGP